MARLSRTAQLRQAIEREISRLESRGYQVSEEVRERALRSWQSVRRYSEENFELLRRHAQSEQGERYEEAERRRRSEIARKAGARRRVKAKIETARVIYGNVLDLIQSHDTNGARALSAALARDIDQYGYFKVVFGMAAMPFEIVSRAQAISAMNYNDKDGRKRVGDAIGALFTIIHQHFPTQDEERVISELSEDPDLSDYDEED